MKINQIMSNWPRTCKPEDSLATAVAVMAEHGVRWLPVVEGSAHLVGVLSDWDICHAVATREPTVDKIAVEGVMCSDVHSCEPGDDHADVLAAMAHHRVRRLPVAEDGKLVGVVTLTDLSRAVSKPGGPDAKAILRTVTAMGEPRSADDYA